jgi:hypothetical protein
MVTVKLRCDKAINKKLKTYKIDKRKLENVINMLINNEVNTYKWKYYDIDLKGIPGCDSGYYWGTDEIEVALNSSNCTTPKQRKMFFLQSIIHEMRHWVQDRLENVPGKALDYSEEDVERRTPKYIKHPHEIEAQLWEKHIEQLYKFL